VDTSLKIKPVQKRQRTDSVAVKALIHKTLKKTFAWKKKICLFTVVPKKKSLTESADNTNPERNLTS